MIENGAALKTHIENRIDERHRYGYCSRIAAKSATGIGLPAVLADTTAYMRFFCVHRMVMPVMGGVVRALARVAGSKTR